MANITEYTTGKGRFAPGNWVQAISLQTGTQYLSSAAIASDGSFSINNIAVGLYNLATGPSIVGPFTGTPGTYEVNPASGVNLGYYNAVVDYGATGNGSTDDTTAIQNAIDAAFAAGGGLVYCPPGDYLCSQVVLKNRVGIGGANWMATRFHQKASSNKDFFINYVSTNQIEANGKFVTIRDLAIYGNSASQASGRGIFFTENPTNGKATNDDTNDAHNSVINVYIEDTKSHGLQAISIQDCRIINVHTFNVKGHGFYPSSDMAFYACVAGSSGLSGWFIETNNVSLNGCKAFFSGAVTAASGHGFQLNLSNAGGVSLVGCIAQDNKANGYYLTNSTTNAILDGCVADSNSTSSAGTFAGVAIDGSSHHNKVRAICFERNSGTPTQTHGLIIASGTVDNDVSIVHHGSGGATVLSALTASDPSKNKVVINSQEGSQTIAFATPITPVPYDGATLFVSTVNSAFTVNATADMHKGTKLRFIFLKDGSGTAYAITWDASYKTNVTAMSATVSSRTIVDFEYDGTNWIQTSSVATL